MFEKYASKLLTCSLNYKRQKKILFLKVDHNCLT